MVIIINSSVIKTAYETRHECCNDADHQDVFNPGSHHLPPLLSTIKCSNACARRHNRRIADFDRRRRRDAWKKGNNSGKNYAIREAPTPLLDPRAVSYNLK